VGDLRVIGAVGKIGSGKDTAVKYISSKCSIHTFSIGDIAREIARNEGLPATRESLQKITEEYYEKYGRTYFVEETIRRIERANCPHMLITGIRAPTDVTTLRRHFLDNFVLICVRADERKRFQRLLSRREPRDPKTWQQFLEQDRAEEKIFQLDEACRLADYRIDNDGTVEELFQKIDEIIMKTLSCC
jgi:dephospho-CoA kinase